MPINGLVVMTPTSIASTGTGNSSSINADGSVDFASCATLSLNGVFTSSYDNYMITIRCLGSDASVYARFRLSGTDSTTGYVEQRINADNTSVAAVRNAIGGDKAWFLSTYNTQRAGAQVFIFGPSLAQPTAYRSTPVSDYLSAYIRDIAGTHSVSTAYDGVSLIMQTGTMSGIVSVYGFNK